MSEANPIERYRIIKNISEDEELSRCLENAVEEIDKLYCEEEKKPLVNNEFFVVSAVFMLCFGCLKLNFVDTLLIISLILLIVAVLLNNKKEQSE